MIRRRVPCATTTTMLDKPVERDDFWCNAATLAFCFLGLQASFVTWGVIQEYIMTKTYESGQLFPSPVFLVASNRTLALIVAFCVVQYKMARGQLRRTAPALSYAPSSLSNVGSSWAQYQALAFVSFPTQTLFKSSKVIPVMIMGKILHGKTYRLVEYMEALCITAGIFLFISARGRKGGHGHGHVHGLEHGHAGTRAAGAGPGWGTESIGVVILCVYVLCDSFTSQWQSRVFKRHGVDQFQMMLGSNAFALLFTGATLLQTGQGAAALVFLRENHTALSHVMLLSLTSATGQCFIFYTIKRFGPVVFTLIMTTRQMMSLVFSCFLYGHEIPSLGVLGCIIVFSTLFHRARRNYLRSKVG